MEAKTCCLPWNHLATHPNGAVSLCCQTDMTNGLGFASSPDGVLHNLESSSVYAIVNSESFKKVRLEMASGVEPKACHRCYENERLGGFSLRLQENKKYGWTESRSSVMSDGTIIPDLEYIELRLGNVCNLKCVTCNSVSSAKWIVDEQKLEKKISWFKSLKGTKQASWFLSEGFYEELSEHKNLKTIYINGGEPLLVKEHKTLLENLVLFGRAKEIELKYSTNLTIKDEEAVELWSQFKNVELMLSLDDLGSRNDYLRYPSKWDQLEKNLAWYLKSKVEDSIIICQTVSALNAEFCSELVLFCQANNIKHTLNLVESPSYLGAASISEENRRKILSFKNILGEENTAKIHAWLERTPYSIESFSKLKEFMSGIDEIRQANSKNLFPILLS